jgi:hypothetical protein
MTEHTNPDATHEGPGGTPEGHTLERPSPDEYGKLGTPAAGLTPSVPHAADADHAAEHAHDTGHAPAHEEDIAPPINWTEWAINAGALALGLLVAIVLMVAAQS